MEVIESLNKLSEWRDEDPARRAVIAIAVRLEDEKCECITDRVIKAEGKNATAAIVANIADIMRRNHAFRKYIELAIKYNEMQNEQLSGNMEDKIRQS